MPIYKYPMTERDFPDIALPPGAEVLHVAVQRPHDSIPTIWAMVPDVSPLSFPARVIRAYGTGQEPKGRHVGTAVAADGALIWHLYDVTGF